MKVEAKNLTICEQNNPVAGDKMWLITHINHSLVNASTTREIGINKNYKLFYRTSTKGKWYEYQARSSGEIEIKIGRHIYTVSPDRLYLVDKTTMKHLRSGDIVSARKANPLGEIEIKVESDIVSQTHNLKIGALYLTNSRVKIRIVAFEPKSVLNDQEQFIAVMYSSGKVVAARYLDDGTVISHGGSRQYNILREIKERDIHILTIVYLDDSKYKTFSDTFNSKQAANEIITRFTSTHQNTIFINIEKITVEEDANPTNS